MNTRTLCSVLTLLASIPGPTASAFQRGLIHRTDRAVEGFILFAPLRSTTTYLIDSGGALAHEWASEAPPGNSVYLLENAHLLRTERLEEHPTFRGGGQGGRICEYTWDGELVWSYTCAGPTFMQHHDVERLPNGNLLAIAWELKSEEEALAAGRDPELLGAAELWPDMVLELRPVPPAGAEVVWEWHIWDHLVQDFDESKANYGEVASQPQLVDINAGGHLVREQRRRMARDRAAELAEVDEELKQLRALGYVGDDDDENNERRRQRAGIGSDWMHTNAIDYNAELDQILLSVRSFNEIWIIDHSTTTEQAAGHAGGRSGRGGDLLYRWGNPGMYRAGDAHQLRGQHDARWIPDGLPGAGNILIFNNINEEVGRRVASSVVEIAPPFDPETGYVRSDAAPFGPAAPLWSYAPGPGSGFFSARLSGAQRLPGGNTLICSGDDGQFLQVTREGEIVWEYRNPFLGRSAPERDPPPRPELDDPRQRASREGRFGRIEGTPPTEAGGPPPRSTPGASVFRALYYAPDYPGLDALESAEGPSDNKARRSR